MDPNVIILLIAFMVLGWLSLLAAFFNWDWYFKTEGARLVTHHLGNKGGRLFYGVLGIILIIASLTFFLL